jgi:hypothetical protein
MFFSFMNVHEPLWLLEFQTSLNEFTVKSSSLYAVQAFTECGCLCKDGKDVQARCPLLKVRAGRLQEVVMRSAGMSENMWAQ